MTTHSDYIRDGYRTARIRTATDRSVPCRRRPPKGFTRTPIRALLVTALVAASVVAIHGGVAAATGPSPISVTPYSGFNPSLTRAPYVTDLAQTTAYVNWATSSNTPGSVQWAPLVSGACPSSVQTWATTSSPVAATTSLPQGIKGGSVDTSTPSSMTGWAFTVTGASSSTSEYQDSVELTGLSADTTYCYSVFSSDTSGALNLFYPTSGSPTLPGYQTFTTLITANTSSTTPVTFDVIGDTGENYAYTDGTPADDVEFSGESPSNPTNPDEAAIYKQIGSSGAQFLLNAGDVGYSGGTASNYGDLEQIGTDPEVSNIFGPDYMPQTGGIPSFVADGNHGQNVATLRTWPTPQTAAASSGTYDFDSYSGTDSISGTFPDDWYAFSTGNVRVYVIDSAWADGSTGTATGSLCSTPSYCLNYQADADEHWQTTSAEYTWLKADLTAHPGGVKFAVFHFPLRSDNATQPSDPYTENTTASGTSTSLENLLSQYGVAMAFNGHAHTYQRFIPNQQHQIINYVTGGGGGVPEVVLGGSTCTTAQQSASIYAIGWNPTTSAGSFCGPSSEATAATPQSAAQLYNFLEVSVSGTTVTVTPTNAAGQTFDVQTYNLATAPTVPTGLTATPVSSTQVNLSWTASTGSNGITGYNIYRNGSYLATTSSGAITAYSDTTASPSTTYHYTVDARDTVGNVSAQCSAVAATTPGPPTLVQSAGSSTTTVTLGSASTAGDLLVLSAGVYTGATNLITGVTDSHGDTWTKIGAYNSSGHFSDGEMWYFPNAPSVTTVTVTTAASAVALQVQEFSGVVGLDTKAGASSTGTTASSGSATPTAAGELAVGFVAGHGSSQAITTTSGYTAPQSQTNTGTSASVATGYEVFSTSGAESFGGTFSTAMYWASGIAFFTT